MSSRPGWTSTRRSRPGGLNFSGGPVAVMSGGGVDNITTGLVHTFNAGETYSTTFWLTDANYVQDYNGPVTADLYVGLDATSTVVFSTWTATAVNGGVTITGKASTFTLGGYAVECFSIENPSVAGQWCNSDYFEVFGVPTTATKLAITTPSDTPAGGTISPAVRVSVEDASGSVVATDNSNVTLAIGTNPAGGTLSGTRTVAAVNGVATFNNLSIDKAGVGYTLTATDGSLTSATSGTFNITFTALTWTGKGAVTRIGARRGQLGPEQKTGQRRYPGVSEREPSARSTTWAG